jgi:cyclic-di-AMP phosphodiesterase PgpH
MYKRVRNLRFTIMKSLRGFCNPKKLAIFLITYIITYSILMTSAIPRKYDLVAGDVAKVDIKAPWGLLDNAATEEKLEKVIESIGPIYVKNTGVGKAAVDKVNNLFLKILTIKEDSEEQKEKLKSLQQAVQIELAEEELVALLNLSKEQLDEVRGLLVKTLGSLYNWKDITEGKEEDLEAAKDFILNEINSSNFSNTVKEIAIKLGSSQIRPNILRDEEQRIERIKEEQKKVAPVVIQKGEIIVKEGTLVTEDQIRILGSLGLLQNQQFFRLYIYLSLGLIVLVALLLQWFFLYRYYRELFDESGKLLLISIINSVSLVLARALSLISPFLIPLACAPILLTLLIDYRVSVVLSSINCILISSTVGFNTEITLIAVLNAVLGSILIKKMQARNDILYSAIYIAIVNAAMSFGIGLQLNSDFLEVLRNSGFVAIGSVIAAVLAIGLLPFFESTFDIVTTVKLLELSNPNSNLLKKLLMEAPGTYHHSVLVANLAEAAAEEVGGNTALARVGAYYHDVGKIKRPYFFKENQIGNDNPHDKVTPNLSALVITSHVKDGLELAKGEKLPRVIRDIIEQHHGTTLVKYFYITMKNLSDNPEAVKEEDFRYPGKIPQSKEAGIIMLADSVEAAVRSINEPSREKIEKMVSDIIRDRLEDGQLDDCELTLRDLEKIKRTFLKSMAGIYHQRIEYPTDKWKIKNEIK